MSNNKKVTELTQVAAMNKSDVFYVVQSGTNDRYATFENMSATVAQAKAGTSEVKFVTPYALDGYFEQAPILFGVPQTTEGHINIAMNHIADAYCQIYTNHVTFNGHEDPLIGFGYNAKNPKAGEPTFILGFEVDYWTSAIDHESEAYFAFTDTDGVTSIRPWQLNINRTTLHAQHQWRGSHTFYDSDGNALIYIMADTGTEGQMTLYGSAEIRKDVNDDPWLYQKNAAGDADLQIAYVNSDDMIEVADGSTPVYFQSNLLIGHNSTTGLTDTSGISIANEKSIWALSYDAGTNPNVKIITPTINYSVSPFSIIIDLGIDGLPTRAITMSLTEQTSEPAWKPNGTIAYADGSSWNPGGTGEGFYGMVNGSWVKL